MSVGRPVLAGHRRSGRPEELVDSAVERAAPLSVVDALWWRHVERPLEKHAVQDSDVAL